LIEIGIAFETVHYHSALGGACGQQRAVYITNGLGIVLGVFVTRVVPAEAYGLWVFRIGEQRVEL
jgi:hypothetical protein